MGLMKKPSSSVFDRARAPQPPEPPQPDPTRFTIDRVEQIGRGLVACLVYPDCTTYEGRKVLVFDGVSMDRLRAETVIDPHFSASSEGIVPVARFEPTTRGWWLARIVAAALI